MRSPLEQLELTEDILPNTLWGLLELALQDIAAVEQDPHYQVSMGDWHSGGGRTTGVCHVCLAGAVIAKRLDVPRTLYVTPDVFPQSIAAKLNALDYLRGGSVRWAVDELYTELEGRTQARERDNVLHGDLRTRKDIPPYARDRVAWRAAMQQLLAELKAANI